MKRDKTDVKNKDMLLYEKSWRKKGYKLIAGVDEAGRGPIAGPLVVAAVILPYRHKILGLDDSKVLSAKKRESLYPQILAVALAQAVIVVDIKEIERLNIYQATKMAMMQAVETLQVKPEVVLTDAMPLQDVDYFVQPIIKGDSLSANIAAASILAKVARDNIMLEIDRLLPQYGFAQHKGYPTRKHIEALQCYGISSVHRLNFAPVRDLREKEDGN